MASVKGIAECIGESAGNRQVRDVQGLVSQHFRCHNAGFVGTD